MHVQLTRGERGYSTLHDILQDDRLSLVARGLLGYLLTVPDAAHLNVRTLADKHLGLGRRGVSKALDELIEAGYYQRRTFRDDKTGHVRTVTYVFDAPQGTATPIPEPPVPAPPGIGDAALGETGELPVGELREEQQRENPTLPPQGAENARKLSAGNISLPRCRREGGASPAGAEDDQPQPSAEPEEPDDPDGPDASQVPETPEDREERGEVPERLAPGTALLTRLGRVEPKLALSAAETRALAPLAQRWLDTGVSDLETRALLTQGLPHVVHSPRALLANRLTRKLPAPRNSPGTYARPLAECATCRDPLPRNQRTGICAHCSGAVARTSPAKPQPKAVAERVAVLRSVLASRRLGATAAT